jgi:archaellum component FlaC
MTIDERLERLTERHEALSGHIELLTADLVQLKERVDDLTSNVDRQRRTMYDMMAGFSSLVELARSQEHRIEGR